MSAQPCRCIVFQWIDPGTGDEEDFGVRDPQGFPDIGEIVTLHTDDKIIHGAVLTREWDYYDPETTRLPTDEWDCTIFLSPVTVTQKSTNDLTDILEAIQGRIEDALDDEFGDA